MQNYKYNWSTKWPLRIFFIKLGFKMQMKQILMYFFKIS